MNLHIPGDLYIEKNNDILEGTLCELQMYDDSKALSEKDRVEEKKVTPTTPKKRKGSYEPPTRFQTPAKEDHFVSYWKKMKTEKTTKKKPQQSFKVNQEGFSCKDLSELGIQSFEKFKEHYMGGGLITSHEWHEHFESFRYRLDEMHMQERLRKHPLLSMREANEDKGGKVHAAVSRKKILGYFYLKLSVRSKTLGRQSSSITLGGNFRKKMSKPEAIWMRELLGPFASQLMESTEDMHQKLCELLKQQSSSE